MTPDIEDVTSVEWPDTIVAAPARNKFAKHRKFFPRNVARYEKIPADIKTRQAVKSDFVEGAKFLFKDRKGQQVIGRYGRDACVCEGHTVLHVRKNARQSSRLGVDIKDCRFILSK